MGKRVGLPGKGAERTQRLWGKARLTQARKDGLWGGGDNLATGSGGTKNLGFCFHESKGGNWEFGSERRS